MPNWCENKLTIKGTKEDLLNFLAQHYVVSNNNDYLDFDTIIPEPRTIEECDSLFVIPKDQDRHLECSDGRTWFDWYGWRCHYWGTKWNSTNAAHSDICPIINSDLYEVTIWYDTAWCPCLPIINTLINLYPNLTFEYCYFESDCWIGGRVSKDTDDVYCVVECSGAEVKQFSIDEGFVSPKWYEE